MTDTLNVTKPAGNQEWLASIHKRVETLLNERAAAAETDGPESVVVRAIDVSLVEIMAFCEKHNIRLLNRDELERKMKESEKGFEEKVDTIRETHRKIYWRLMDETVEREVRKEAEARLPIEMERARRKRRQEAVLARATEEGVKTLHVAVEEDPLTCEIVYQGPVFRLINPAIYSEKVQEVENEEMTDDDDLDRSFDDAISRERKARRKRKYGYNPFLLPTYFFGKHPACFHEQKEMPTDFMAGLSFDPAADQFKVKAIDPGITIRKKGTDAFAPFMQSSYDMVEGDVVRLGQYHLVVERNHGYSVGALYEEARSHLEEMLEIIFDTDNTTEAQNLGAYKNMTKVLGCNLPADRKDKLKDYVARVYAGKFEKLRKEVKAWENNLRVPDARKFAPLLMTLKELSKGRCFFPFSPGMELGDLCQEARRRLPACIDTDRLNQTEFAIWMVEMARFVEMGLLTVADFHSQNADEKWQDVQEILSVRKLIDALYLDGQDQLPEIMRLLETARGLVLYDIYGADEIMIRNQDVDLKLSPRLPVVSTKHGENSYVAQIARKIARNAWAKLHQKRTAEERKNELNLIRTLIGLGKVKPIHLVEFGDGTDDVLAREREIEAKIMELEVGVANSLRREELQKQEEERARLLAEQAFAGEYEDRRQIIDRSMSIIGILKTVGEKPGFEDLYELIRGGDLFADPAVTGVIKGCLEEVVDKPVEREMADYEGRMTKVVLQVAPMQKSWTEVEKNWREVVGKNLQNLLADALAGKHSSVTAFLIEKFEGVTGEAGSGLDYDWQKLNDAREFEQFRALRARVLNDQSDGEIWPDWLQGSDRREFEKVVDKVRHKLGARWLKDLLPKVKTGNDVGRYVVLIRRLLIAVPGLRYELSPAEHDLLL